jgi:hypothetical protein
MWLVVIPILGAACVAAAVYLIKARECERRRVLEQAGAALGLRAYEKGEHLIVPSVEIMRRRGRRIGAVLEGEWNGRRIKVFDVSYPTRIGAARTTVFMLRLSAVRVPEFAALRRSAWLQLDRPAVDLPLVEDPPAALQRIHRLYAPDGQWPFGDELAQLPERLSRWSFEGRGSGLFLYRRAKRAPTRALEAWIDDVSAAATAFAECVAAPAETAGQDGEPEFGRKLPFSSKISVRL